MICTPTRAPPGWPRPGRPTRQVIVFTHDMAFLLLLDEACRPKKGRDATPVAYRLISRAPENAGYCHQDPPANVMPLEKLIDGIRAHLANVKIDHERGDQAKWLREVTSFQLRTTWERAIDEVVGSVIRHLSRKVDTPGLIKLTVLTDADCTAIREAFRRCSALLHSQPGEINYRSLHERWFMQELIEKDELTPIWREAWCQNLVRTFMVSLIGAPFVQQDHQGSASALLRKRLHDQSAEPRSNRSQLRRDWLRPVPRAHFRQ